MNINEAKPSISLVNENLASIENTIVEKYMYRPVLFSVILSPQDLKLGPSLVENYYTVQRKCKNDFLSTKSDSPNEDIMDIPRFPKRGNIS